MQIKFQAFDYTAADEFELAEYEFRGDSQSHWEILRNGSLYLRLGKGYQLLQNQYCGICSTDISRRFLPFPLPQVIGHEVIGKSLQDGRSYAVEINDTSWARGEEEHDVFIRSGLPTHSPSRMVLGIDRLPGGFAPYLLAPQNAMVDIGELDFRTAVLLEPFAAALHAVHRCPPQPGEAVAVLGPRKLGSLLIAALSMYRSQQGFSFTIHALTRRTDLAPVYKHLGADAVQYTSQIESEQACYSRIYDTTGSSEAFLQALQWAEKEVHLKTTNGQTTAGISHMTDLVVDELCLAGNVPYPSQQTQSSSLYAGKQYPNFAIPPAYKVYTGEPKNAIQQLIKDFPQGIPRFDVALAQNLAEVDDFIRTGVTTGSSLLKPRGRIVLQMVEKSVLSSFLAKGGVVSSSRCGDFHQALDFLQQHPAMAKSIGEQLVSDIYPAEQIPLAYDKAKQKDSIKVVLQHTTQ
ncbi:MAG: alcohol dehydrogenase catalytic domain-containing protein [Spirochaetota bacterium]